MAAPHAPDPKLVPSTLVKLTLRAEKVKDRDYFSKSDPLCVVFRQGGRLAGKLTWQELGRTELIRNNLNPEWSKTITMEYFFEERQKLKFEIYDMDNESADLDGHDFLGRVECDLAEIVSANHFHRQLVSVNEGLKGRCGELYVTCEELDGGSRECVVFNASGENLDKKDFFGKSDPYLSIYRLNDSGSRVLVHRTEFIKKTLNPTWKTFEIEKRALCLGDTTKSIRIECYDNDDDTLATPDYIGGVTMTVDELLQNKKPFELINEKKREKKGKKYSNSGVLTLRTNVVPQFTFLDFIAGGTQLDFSVAIDFTSSNGQVHSPTSLHFLSTEKPNQYEIAIRSVLEICQFYNNSKLFDAYGFGAAIPPELTKVKHVFNLNKPGWTGAPAVVGVDGVMHAYRQSLHQVKLYGPTHFAPIIREAARQTALKMSTAGARYEILLIITDGAICDMERTKRAIIEASALPLSVIIVGVGNAEFDSMEELDGDGVRLQVDGRFAARDIVQFVPLRNFVNMARTDIMEHDRIMGLLAKEVLAEVPGQLTSFMKSTNIHPRPASNPFPKDPPAVPQQHDVPMLPPLRTDPSHPAYPKSGAPPIGFQNGPPPYPQQFGGAPQPMHPQQYGAPPQAAYYPPPGQAHHQPPQAHYDQPPAQGYGQPQYQPQSMPPQYQQPNQHQPGGSAPYQQYPDQAQYQSRRDSQQHQQQSDPSQYQQHQYNASYQDHHQYQQQQPGHNDFQQSNQSPPATAPSAPPIFDVNSGVEKLHI